ncbi:MAG: hypothetical protein ACXVAY_01540 [Mucilaginibacter sp.]
MKNYKFFIIITGIALLITWYYLLTHQYVPVDNTYIYNHSEIKPTETLDH